MIEICVKMVDLTICDFFMITLSLFLLADGRSQYDDRAIFESDENRSEFNDKILFDTIFVDSTIPPAEDTKLAGSSKIKSKKIQTEPKVKPADKQPVAVSAKPAVAPTVPPALGLNLFGPQGLSERFLQDPRSRLLLSRLGALSPFLDSLNGQQNQRNSRQLPLAGFGGGNAFNPAGGLNGLFNAFNPAGAGAGSGRAPAGFNAGNFLDLIAAAKPQPKVGGSFDIIPPKNFQSVQGPPSSDIFGGSASSSLLPSSAPDDSSNFFCNMLRFFLSRLF